MTLLNVLTVPDPRLRIKAKPVSVVNDTIRIIFDDMLETMYAEDGLGLAAPQVGIDLRLVVIDISDHYGTTIFKMINPEITWRSAEMNVCNEGCLSVPEQRAEVSRPKAIKMHYLDENGTLQHIESDDILATCIQHELDHLDGKLYIDYLSSLKRQMFINKVKRMKKYED
jgi:peptide deformylase